MVEKYVDAEMGEIIHKAGFYEFSENSSKNIVIDESICIFCLSRGLTGNVPPRMWFRVTHRIPLGKDQNTHDYLFLYHCE